MKRQPMKFPALLDMNPTLIALMLYRLDRLSDGDVEDLYEDHETLTVCDMLAARQRIRRDLEHCVTALRLEKPEDVEIAIECCEGNTYFADTENASPEEWSLMLGLVNAVGKISGRIIQPPNC